MIQYLISFTIIFSGFVIGILICKTAKQNRGRRLKEANDKYHQNGLLQSVTKFIFVTTQFFALAWVCTSYGIAIYSTVKLGQVYTMSELSEPAIRTILGVGFLKVLENIFEHNDNAVFGHNNKNISESDVKEDTYVESL